MWTQATFTKFSSIRKHLHDFNSDLSITKLSDVELQGLMSYMEQIGLRNTTISKNVAFVRWFLRWANSRGLYNGTLHETWRPKLKGVNGNQKEIIYLEWDELMAVYNFEVPESKKYLARVRDVFCFQCFTGLRYSDVAKLTRADVKENHIQVITQKTVDGLRIELNKYSRAILEKYEEFHFKGDKVFPVISNVNMNIFLKELCQLARIDQPQRIVYFLGNRRIEEVHPKYELITTHAGRRTFVISALTLGIPAEVIMRFTGHSDFSAMKPYVKIVDTLKAQEMSKFDMK